MTRDTSSLSERVSRRKFIAATGATGLTVLAGCSGGGDGGGGGSDGGNGGGDGSDGGDGGGSDGGGSEGGNGGDGGGDSATTAANGATPTDSAGTETTSIKFWHAMGGDLGKFIDTLASEFQSQADGIELEATQKGSYRETLNATTSAVQAGNPPAVAQIFEIGTQLALDSGAFTPIEDIIPSDRVDFDNYLDPVMSYYRIDGKLNSMPFNSSNAIFYYNKNAFREAGLDPEKPPTTYQGVLDASKTLTDAGVVEKGTTWPNHSWFVEQWFAEQNQPLVNNKNGRASRADEIFLQSDAAKNIFDWWTTLYDEGQYLNPGIEAWGAAQQAFLTGRTGMLGYSTSSIAPMKEGARKNGFELGTMYLPVPEGNRNGVVIGGASLWVPSGLSEAKKQAAGEFLVWLTQPAQQMRWHKNTGYFPVREEAISQLQSQGFYDENPNFMTAIEQLRKTKDSPATRGALMGPFRKVRTIVEEGYVSMIQKKNIDVQTGLKRIDKQSEQALKSYNQKVS